MTNYNDGKWHRWNGGECPVHPESRIEWVRFVGFDPYRGRGDAGRQSWDRITAFRVIKEHREPREFWVVTYDGTAWDYEDQAKKRAASCQSPIIHVREVLE